MVKGENKVDEEIDLKEVFIPFKNILPEAKDIPDTVFHLLSKQIESFDGFYKIDQMFQEFKLTDVQKHFLTALFFHFTQYRQTPEKNAEQKRNIMELYKSLGYERFRLFDKEFNRKIYKIVMYSYKGI